MKQILKSNALVIYGMRWSNTSKIVHFFTEERGYIKAIAHGAMRPKSPFRGVLENLNQVQVIISIKENRGLQIVTQAELLDSYINIRDNLEATAVASSMFELIRSLVPFKEAAHPIFGFTVNTLHSMNKNPGNHQMLFLLGFLLYLSDYLGFRWNLSECRVCQNLPTKFPLKIDVINGAIICRGCESGAVKGNYYLNREQWFLLYQLQRTGPAQYETIWEKIPKKVSYEPLLDLLLSHINYHTEQTVQLKSLKMYLP